MALNIRTPGVDIEEESKFPPSVVPVDTAIPAFIGYTEALTMAAKTWSTGLWP
jgi:phage tail sheath protein FI